MPGAPRLTVEADHRIKAVARFDGNDRPTFTTGEGTEYTVEQVTARYVAPDCGPARLHLDVIAVRGWDGETMDFGFDSCHKPVADLLTEHAPRLLAGMLDRGLPATLVLSPVWFEEPVHPAGLSRFEEMRRRTFAEWACRAHGLEVCCATSSQTVRAALTWEQRMVDQDAAYWDDLGVLGRMWVAARHVWADQHFQLANRAAAAQEVPS